MAHWQAQQARECWDDVLEQADSEGPQIITQQGKERAVVLSIEKYRELEPQPTPASGEKPDFITFLLSGPKFDDFEIERDMDTGREIEFE